MQPKTDKSPHRAQHDPLHHEPRRKAVDLVLFAFENGKNGDTKRASIEEFNSDNTRRLGLEETKAKIVSLEYIQNGLKGIPNVAK